MVMIDGNTITIASNGGPGQSFSKVELSHGLRGDIESNAGMNTIALSKVNSNAVFASVSDSGAVSRNPASVHSDDDLALFIANLMHRDNKIKTTTYATTSVALTYHDTAKLFGFIPLTRVYTVTASDLDSDDTISVHVPWWSIFASKENVADSDVKAKISSNVKAAVSSSTDVSTKQALAIAAIADTINANADVDANASAETTVE
jgi:hypothetical protein